MREDPEVEGNISFNTSEQRNVFLAPSTWAEWKRSPEPK
jgi:hypothetical protein